MSVFVGNIDAAPNNQYQLAIYTDTGGVPGARVASSGTGTLAANTWNTLPVSATLQANSSYWLMYNTNGRTPSVNNMYYNVGSPRQGGYSRASVSFGTWPATFGAVTLTNSVYSLFAADGSAPPPPPPPPGPDPRAEIGEWSPVMNWPLIAIHANLLKNGKVLVYDDEFTTTQPRLWDPATQTFTLTPPVNRELWCSGHAQLPDGRIFVAGGHTPSVGEVGINTTFQYAPDTNTWTRTADMAYDRWYPALTKLSDGRVSIVSGQITTNVWADIPEIYNPADGSINTLTTVATTELEEEEYPANFHLPNGMILAISPEHRPVQLLDPNAGTWTNVNTTPVPLGSAVQYRPGKILMSGGR